MPKTVERGTARPTPVSDSAGLDAHHIRNRQADQKRLRDALRHHERGTRMPVEIAQETEQHAGEHRFGREPAQVFKGSRDVLRVAGKQRGQPIALEQRQQGDDHADARAHAHAVEHALAGAVFPVRAHICATKEAMHCMIEEGTSMTND